MRVHSGSKPSGCLGDVLAPDLGVAQEKALIGCVPACPIILAARGLVQCHEREPDTAVVGSILAEGQFAVQLYIRDGAEIPVLVYQTGGAFLEPLRVLGRPPV